MSKYKIFIQDGKVRFTIGNQTFTLDYEPDDEPDITEYKQLEWMVGMLNIALRTLSEKPLRLRDMVREENDK